MATLSSFAQSVLSVEQALDRDSWPDRHLPANDMTPPPPTRPARTSRRATSYYNTFQTYCQPDTNELPPSYSAAIRHKPIQDRTETGVETLPSYSCSVSAEAKVLLNLELINPLHTVSASEWREIYVVVVGTMLNVHRVKDGRLGKLLRSYTLQHAEVGLALDSSHHILIPNTRLAHLIPGPAREKAFRKDQRLFIRQKQYLLRLRVETDQLIFAQSSEEATHDLVNAISAAIDIAQPIDERSATRQCTVPRRRRRRPQFNGDVSDPTVIAEQERIFREMYPSLAVDTAPQQESIDQPSTASAPLNPLVVVVVARDEDETEIDVTAMREEAGEAASQRPDMHRSTTSDSLESSNDDYCQATDRTNLDSEGKWRPPHNHSAGQTVRYARRCMPVLSADAPRASDVLICDGRRVRINYRHETLDDWQLKPPSYKSHGFPSTSPTLERSPSTTSVSSSELRISQVTSNDDITPLSVIMSNADLGKGAIMPIPNTAAISIARSNKARRSEIEALNAMQGVVYCF